MVWFCLATGIFFQFPLIIVTLVYLKVFPVSILKSNRRSVFLGLMIFSALISPGGDFISLPLMTMAMYGLYEFSILISNKIDKRQLDAELDKMDDV